MSNPIPSSSTPTPRRPTIALHPTPAADKQKKAVGNAKIDKFTDGLGAQGFVQDTSRFMAKWAVMAGHPSRVLSSVSAIAAGEKEEISKGVARVVSKVDCAAHVVVPVRAEAITHVAAPVAKAGGVALRFIGKVGPIISVPFAFYDVAKAWTEPDATKKDAAWMNATITVAGTGVGLAGIVFTAPAVTIPLLIASAVLGVYQLLDTYAWQGKTMDWLGEKVMHPIRHALGL